MIVFVSSIIHYYFTAVSPDDYTALVSQQLTFTSGQSSNSADNTQCTDVGIVNDEAYEGSTETFSVYLTNNSPSVAINSALANATITIFDNDSKFSAVTIVCCIMTNKY